MAYYNGTGSIKNSNKTAVKDDYPKHRSILPFSCHAPSHKHYFNVKKNKISELFSSVMTKQKHTDTKNKPLLTVY